MLECHYEKEPLDLRLILLRVWKQKLLIAAITLLGTLIFGGGYYLKNIVIPPKQYAAMSLYQVEYKMDPISHLEYTYINNDTWRRWMTTQEFLDLLYENLEGTSEAQIDRDTMKSYLSAELLTDLRMPDTIVTTPDPQLSLQIAAAVEESMVDFAGIQQGIESITVVDPAVDTVISNDSRPLNACILSASVSFLLILALVLMIEISADSIWLPAAISDRFGLKVLGTAGTVGLEANIAYLLRNKCRIGVLAVEGDTDIAGIVQVLKTVEVKKHGNTAESDGVHQWIPLPSVELCPEICETIRSLDGLILSVNAGRGQSRRLEEVLAFLKAQDCAVDAVFLAEADESLIRQYYWREALWTFPKRHRTEE
ncbi:MAG: hypothetical protein IJZ34_09415 [Lachnospiraceae bacterium]|nr:hypothetical protein [Lachnospiraceae bacterium]